MLWDLISPKPLEGVAEEIKVKPHPLRSCAWFIYAVFVKLIVWRAAAVAFE
jgi:hypothetical protein